MILITYFLVLSFFIYRTSLFGILKDETLHSKFYLFAFIIKCLGIAVFYFVYKKFYGGINYSDTKHFMNDSKLIHDVYYWSGSDFFKTLFGLHDESASAELFQKFIQHTSVWDKSPDEFLYNDNRLVIRINALIHFISFGNYFVHALFSCLFSFIGIHWIYKAFKFLFKQKEISFFVIWILFPSVWFWTAGVLKEGPALFFMGALLISLKKIIIDKKYNLVTFLFLLFSVAITFYFKQYLLLPLFLMSLLFFVFYSKTISRKITLYLSCLILFSLLVNFGAKFFLKDGVLSALSKRQRTFIDMSKGGIFLLNNKKFVRLPFDFNLIKIDSSAKPRAVTINAGASYMYWEHSHQHDTLYCSANTDTLSKYSIHYTISPANSTIAIPLIDNTFISFFKSLPFMLYITLFKPLFFDARNTLDILASFENLIILFAFVLLFFYFLKKRMFDFSAFYFLSYCVLVLISIGISSPNIGAIERYRALLIPFLLMTCLLYLNPVKFEQSKLARFFKNDSE